MSVLINRRFFVNGAAANQYTVHVKGAKYLAKNIGVDLTGGNVSGVQIALSGGDANNDNVVDIADFGILVSSYNLSAGMQNYDDRADLNADGSVDIADFGLIVNNFGSSGDN